MHKSNQPGIPFLATPSLTGMGQLFGSWPGHHIPTSFGRSFFFEFDPSEERWLFLDPQKREGWDHQEQNSGSFMVLRYYPFLCRYAKWGFVLFWLDECYRRWWRQHWTLDKAHVWFNFFVTYVKFSMSTWFLQGRQQFLSDARTMAGSHGRMFRSVHWRFLVHNGYVQPRHTKSSKRQSTMFFQQCHELNQTNVTSCFVFSTFWWYLGCLDFTLNTLVSRVKSMSRHLQRQHSSEHCWIQQPLCDLTSSFSWKCSSFHAVSEWDDLCRRLCISIFPSWVH